MREILFRGKRVDGKRWEQGYYTNLPTETESGGLPDGYKDFICTLNSLNHDLIEVLPETVGQYTGSNDKNRRKIFEGDICEVKTVYMNETGTYVVKHYNCGFRLSLKSYCMCLCEVDERDIKVVGNIHDNPKLLEDKA